MSEATLRRHYYLGTPLQHTAAAQALGRAEKPGYRENFERCWHPPQVIEQLRAEADVSALQAIGVKP
jgi:hypothetical protein